MFYGVPFFHGKLTCFDFPRLSHHGDTHCEKPRFTERCGCTPNGRRPTKPLGADSKTAGHRKYRFFGPVRNFKLCPDILSHIEVYNILRNYIYIVTIHACMHACMHVYCMLQYIIHLRYSFISFFFVESFHR